jgi:malate dehydrogenase (oxaloacetate-decarboxylating)(NADP+)
VLSDPRHRELASEYHSLARRRGVTAAIAKDEMRSQTTLIGAMLLRRGEVDAMLCGTHGTYEEHLRYVRDVIGPRRGIRTMAAMNMLMLPGRQLFICDTYSM